MGEAGEGQNITHQQKKMGENVLREFRDRFGIVDLPDERIPEVPFLRFAEDSAELAYLRERRAALGGPLPVRRDALVARRCRCRSCRRSTRSSSRPAIARSPPRWRSCGSSTRCCATSRSASTWCRSCRTSRAPSAWRACSASSASVAGRAALPARGRQPAHVLQGGQVRPDAAGGHQRARRHVVLDRGGHLLLGVGLPDDPVLHLLLDVRLPAHRRPGLGRGRHAGARLPDRRHRGPHHAQRRGPAARGRAQPPALGHHPQLRLLRPDLRLRGGGDRPGRPAADVRRAGGRLLLPHHDERELRAPRPARRGDRRDEVVEGIKKGHVPAAFHRRRGTARACSCWAAARSCARSRPPPSCWPPTGASPPTSGAARASPSWAATAMDVERWNLLHPAEPQRISWVDECLGERPAGPVVAATDYMRAFADQIRAVRARHRRYGVLGTDGFGRSDYRRQAAPLLRGRPPLRRARRAVRLAAEGAVPADSAAEAIKPLRHRPGQAQPRCTPERTKAPELTRSTTNRQATSRSRSPTSATSTTSR